MRIRVSDIKDEGLRIETHMDPRWLDNIPELCSGTENTRLISDFDIDLEVTRVLREVSVLGKISFSIEAPCSRCLEAVRLDFMPEIKLLISPSDKIRDEEDLDHETYSGDEVDLGNYLREQIAITLPVKVICSDDCKGLCTNCGINLNQELCGCDKEWIDPRFAALKKLKI
ncbi:MAG: DUF177 domain-containing protein [Deltaproteobacteria bacterium]